VATLINPVVNDSGRAIECDLVELQTATHADLLDDWLTLTDSPPPTANAIEVQRRGELEDSTILNEQDRTLWP
jgi:hypothetical protein